MTAVIEKRALSPTRDRPLMFQVWIDTNCGLYVPPDWEWNSPPKPLAWALDEACECRRRGFPAVILPEGQQPEGYRGED